MARDAKDQNHVIAALRLLGAASEGAAVDPVLGALGWPGVASIGRLGVSAPPLATSDRPSWNDYRRLLRENTLLMDHAEMLACALGACPNCWGAIPDCEDCGGRGKPGAYRPDPDCFARFVQPVVDRMRAERGDPATGRSPHGADAHPL